MTVVCTSSRGVLAAAWWGTWWRARPVNCAFNITGQFSCAGDTTASSTVPTIFQNLEPGSFVVPRERPLVSKLELLVELLFRRVVYDPVDPNNTDWSADRVLRTLKKQDHDMGS
jgi:hypothetical protein